MDLVDVIVRGGTAGAVVVVVWMFLKEIRKMRQEFMQTINNHIDHNTEVLSQLKDAIAHMTGYLDRRGG